MAELLVSKLDERLKNKENRWKEFMSDADTFSDNFNELLGITKSIKISELGRINEEFKKLKEKIEKFLKVYDKDKNGEIDVEELKEGREKLAKELGKRNNEGNSEEKSKLWAIIEAAKDLEDIVIAYRQERDVEKIEETNQQLDKQTKEIATQTDSAQEEAKQGHQAIDVDERSKERVNELIEQQEIAPK